MSREIFLILVVIIVGIPKVIKFLYSYYRLLKEKELRDNNEFDWSDVI